VTSAAAAGGPPVAHRRPARVDVGRLFVVPLFSLLFLANLAGLVRAAQASVGPAARVVSVVASLLMLAFYVLVIVAYLGRGRASATTASLPAKVAAVVATCVPMTLPLLTKPEGSIGADLVASVLVVAGGAWSLWSLTALGRNLSIVAQARGLSTEGPYRWVRHPLYVGEIVAVLGLAARSDAAVAYVMWVLLVALQAYRASVEERLLAAELPGYDAYRARTGRFVPRLAR
jgi:protein-S-isoprenylcysteine O-methyltransferase Ste14